MICISASPAALARYPRGFTGHVAHPTHSIQFFFKFFTTEDGNAVAARRSYRAKRG
jgi:hypothetical protein